MAFTKKTFEKGALLTAADLNNLGDGIEEALASSANLEKGAGAFATQQAPRSGEIHGNKVSQKEGETALHFDFVGYEGAKEITGKESETKVRMEYGAIGNYSAAINGRCAALNKHAFAANNSTVAKGEESFAAGYETVAEGNGSSAFGSRTWAKGKESHTEGILTFTEGEGSHAEGSLTKAKGNYSHAEGYLTETRGLYSHVEGSATQTGGFSAHAEGNETLADANASHAEGSGSKVISYQVTLAVHPDDSPILPEEPTPEPPSYNDFESIEDFRVRAAACAHAEGNNTAAMGYSAHSEGVGTKAYGRASHAEGWETQAGELTVQKGANEETYLIPNLDTGTAAHAEGYCTKALGNFSHASGFETIADKEAQTVVGKYNEESLPGSVFVVGGGNSNYRQNVLEVICDEDGNTDIIVQAFGNRYSLTGLLEIIAQSAGAYDTGSFYEAAAIHNWY